MDAFWSAVAIGSALAVGAVSPGPSFIVVARNSIALSRRHGMATACGMGLGAATFAVLALLGVHAVLTAVPLAFWALKIVGHTRRTLACLTHGMLSNPRLTSSRRTLKKLP